MVIYKIFAMAVIALLREYFWHKVSEIQRNRLKKSFLTAPLNPWIEPILYIALLVGLGFLTRATG